MQPLSHQGVGELRARGGGDTHDHAGQSNCTSLSSYRGFPLRLSLSHSTTHHRLQYISTQALHTQQPLHTHTPHHTVSTTNHRASTHTTRLQSLYTHQYRPHSLNTHHHRPHGLYTHHYRLHSLAKPPQTTDLTGYPIPIQDPPHQTTILNIHKHRHDFFVPRTVILIHSLP